MWFRQCANFKTTLKKSAHSSRNLLSNTPRERRFFYRLINSSVITAAAAPLLRANISLDDVPHGITNPRRWCHFSCRANGKSLGYCQQVAISIFALAKRNYLDCTFQFTYKKIMHHALAATNWMTLACPLLTSASTCRAQPLRAARFSLSKL